MIKLTHSLMVVAALNLPVPALAADHEPGNDSRNRAGYVTPISMLLGAIAGGPIAALAATAFGGVIDHQIEKNYKLKQELVTSQRSRLSEQTAYQQELAELRTEWAERESQFQIASRQWKSSASPGFDQSLGYTLQFRTGSSVIEPHYLPQLDNLAQLLGNLDKLEIQLSGYADQIGDSTFNHELSKDRVEQVKRHLVEHGIDAGRITSHAYGESRPLNSATGIETNPFERRVTMQIYPAPRSVVSNQDH